MSIVVNSDLFGRYRLIGDEDTGVGIECKDHWDGGRPLAYYSGVADSAYADDPDARVVSSLPELLGAALSHEHDAHSRT